jgi:hypothetical protein
VSGAALKNPAELPARLDLVRPERVLIVDAPQAFSELLAASRGTGLVTENVTEEDLSSIKEAFDAVLLWRESRVGSRSAMDGALRRLAPGGAFWAVIAMRKVRGPETPAAHRLELSDLAKAFEKHGMASDREVRVTSWHAAHRFVKGNPAYST